MWHVTFRGLLAHKFRLALTGLAIVLGVSFVAGTFVLTDTMRRVFEDLFTEATSGVDITVRSVGGLSGLAPGMSERDPIPESMLDTVLAVEGVDVAAGGVEGFAQLVGRDGEPVGVTMAPSIGFSWTPEPLNPTTVRSGRPPTRPGETVIDASTARTYGFAVGDEVTILLVGHPETFTIVGIVGFGDADNLAGATLAGFELETAQRILGRVGVFDTIEVAAASGIDTDVLAGRIQAVLPAGFEAVGAEELIAEWGAQLDEGMGFFTTALLVFAIVALFVGAFIIANTFSIVVAQRTREFAMLRAVGASSGQVVRSVAGEGAIVGVVAGAVGVGAGVLLASGLRRLLDAFGMSVPQTDMVVLPRTIAVSLGVGVGVTLVSILVPARRAARVEPLAAMRAASGSPKGLSILRIAGGVTVTAAGATTLTMGLYGRIGEPLPVVGAGALIIFAGVAMLAPLVTRPVGHMVGTPGARLGTPGLLARGNVSRNPARAAATASALMIGLALVAFVAILGSSFKVSMRGLVEESFLGDFLVETPQFGYVNGFSPELTESLKEAPELAVVSPQRVGFWDDGTATRVFGGIEPETFRAVSGIQLLEGSYAGLERGGVLVASTRADARGLVVGDTLKVDVGQPTTIEVAGVFETMPAMGFDYLVSMPTYESLSRNRLDQYAMIAIADGVDPTTARLAVERLTEAYPTVLVHNREELVADREGEVDQLLALVSVLLLLAIVIALLGITNTLALSVFERTREIGLLRAVGMSRRQTRSMIRWEALSVAVLGALLGIGVGVFFGWAVTGALHDQGIRTLSVPVGQLGIYVAVAGVAGVVAGVVPARRAARLDVLEAIATG